MRSLLLSLLVCLCSCNNDQEAHFLIKNKGVEIMTNVFIRVFKDSVLYSQSEIINIPANSQTEISVNIPNTPYHQGYEFNYTLNNKTTSDNYSTITTRTPAYQSILLEHQADTVWVNTFYVNKDLNQISAYEWSVFDKNMNEGKKNFVKGEYKDALDYFQKAMAVHPTSPDLHYYLGVIQKEYNRPDRYRIHIETSLQYGGPSFRSSEQLNQNLQEINWCYDAIRIGQDMINYNPNDLAVYYGLIHCHDQFGEGELVNKYCQELISRNHKLSAHINNICIKYTSK